MTSKQPKTKIFRISGWVQVDVFAFIEAKNITEAKKYFKQQEAKFGAGNGTIWNYQEGDWASEVTFDEPIKEEEDGPCGVSNKGHTVFKSEIADRAQLDKKEVC